ncbi:MAG: CHRD domain-containing protein [Candidatus Eisenbacteria bacterium]|nr:CHRD domain-containing protein [Candidatus Eisenbacteria bacterium]
MHVFSLSRIRLWLLVLLFGMVPGAAWAQAYFVAQLSGNQENPPVAGSGSGTAAFTLIGSDLYYSLTVQGLTGPITAAHIHSGARGVNGGVVVSLGGDFIDPPSGVGTTASGHVSGLTAAQVTDLLSGVYYVNVHTAANPGGEVRGQLDLAAGTHLTADLSGADENPPVAGAGRGTAALTLTDEGLMVDLTVTGLTGALTAAHFHGGDIGVNGGVVFDLTSSFTGNHARAFWRRGAAAPNLTPALVQELLAGRLYINVHTAANPGGEVRGQVQCSSGFGLSAKIDGGQEVPPVGGPGEGSAAFTLTPSGLVYDLTVTGLSGAITAAHFHRAPAGTNGSVVRDIGSSFVGNTASGVWTPQDSQPLTPALMCEILAGNIYVNVHTAANPAGEARGQLLLNTDRTSMTATLRGTEEEPPNATAGTGTGTFRIGPAGVEFDISVEGLTGAITAAHIHNAAIGTNGGVVFDLGPFFGGTPHARGTWAAPTLAQVKNLLRGDCYVNVHTAANPGGEIRGQILLSSGAGMVFPLTGDQEEPPVASAGVGTGSATLTTQGLVLNATVDGLTGVFTASHFHSGETGVNGGVVRDLSPAFAGGHAEDVWSPADSSPLTNALAQSLLTGGIYANVHSTTNPAGEIRGQVYMADGFFADTQLNGGSEVPPVATPALGTGAFRASEGALVYDVTYDGLEGAFNASHFHRGSTGVNGPVLFNITGTFVGGTAKGVWGAVSGTALTASDVCDYLGDALYVNVHSTTAPAGEIRGDLGDLTPADAPIAEATRPRLDLQAWPNPTSGASRVRFDLPRSADVTLTLHTVDGAKVATVYRGTLDAGVQEVDVDGRALPVGLYFLRAETSQGTRSIKWIRVD